MNGGWSKNDEGFPRVVDRLGGSGPIVDLDDRPVV